MTDTATILRWLAETPPSARGEVRTTCWCGTPKCRGKVGEVRNTPFGLMWLSYPRISRRAQVAGMWGVDAAELTGLPAYRQEENFIVLADAETRTYWTGTTGQALAVPHDQGASIVTACSRGQYAPQGGHFHRVDLSELTRNAQENRADTRVLPLLGAIK